MQEENNTIDQPFNLKDELKQLKAYESFNKTTKKRRIKKIVGIKKNFKDSNCKSKALNHKSLGQFKNEGTVGSGEVKITSLGRRMKKDQLGLMRCLLRSNGRKIRRI